MSTKLHANASSTALTRWDGPDDLHHGSMEQTVLLSSVASSIILASLQPEETRQGSPSPELSDASSALVALAEQKAIGNQIAETRPEDRQPVTTKVSHRVADPRGG